jgi:hypothetical protein
MFNLLLINRNFAAAPATLAHHTATIAAFAATGCARFHGHVVVIIIVTVVNDSGDPLHGDPLHAGPPTPHARHSRQPPVTSRAPAG